MPLVSPTELSTWRRELWAHEFGRCEQVLGVRLEFDPAGRATGLPAPSMPLTWCEGKAAALDAYGVVGGRLCLAVGNSMDDVPMLRRAQADDAARAAARAASVKQRLLTPLDVGRRAYCVSLAAVRRTVGRARRRGRSASRGWPPPGGGAARPSAASRCSRRRLCVGRGRGRLLAARGDAGAGGVPPARGRGGGELRKLAARAARG